MTIHTLHLSLHFLSSFIAKPSIKNACSMFNTTIAMLSAEGTEVHVKHLELSDWFDTDVVDSKVDVVVDARELDRLCQSVPGADVETSDCVKVYEPVCCGTTK